MIRKEVEPIEGEILIDKAGKGVGQVSDFFMFLQNLGITAPDVMRHNHRCLRSYHHEGGQ